MKRIFEIEVPKRAALELYALGFPVCKNQNCKDLDNPTSYIISIPVTIKKVADSIKSDN